MKKVLLLPAIIIASAFQVWAQVLPGDTLGQINLEEVIVSATRAGQNTPVAYSNISSTDIRKENAARNIPTILQHQPSIVSFSEDGLGVGNTAFRIRGTDATRINVTLNGMPLNNPESQEVYWVNLPDLSNSLHNIQIQRGVGTSTSGSAAFGASISLQTTAARSSAYGEASTAVGSYGTFSSNIAAGSGIMKNGLSVDARYARVMSDGYIRNGKVNHSNLYAALSHYSDRQMIRLIYMKGIQHTGITWEGVSTEQMLDEEYGRRYNPAGEYFDDAGNRRYYDNETDNYYSDILQLTFSRELNRRLSVNAGLSYNHGYGYYENYRHKRKFADFGLTPQIIDDSTYLRSDFVRRKLMSNDFYVANFHIRYTTKEFELSSGAMYSQYQGNHFGRLPWIKHAADQSLQAYEWYRNKGNKRELNFFSKVEYHHGNHLSLFADIQYRYIQYRFSGTDDDLMELKGTYNYHFFNPKAGLSFQVDNRNRLYASVAVGQREPLRADLKDGIKGGAVNAIQPERMIDYELGYKFQSPNGIRVNANFYLMDYHNQMVQTGRLNDIGYKLMENVKDSYRAGIEIETQIPLYDRKFIVDFNATLSRNKIADYTAYYDEYDNPDDYQWIGQVAKDYGTTNISFSPEVVSAIGATWQPTQNIFLNLVGKYVSKQYLDNTSDNAKSIDAYFVSNFTAGYTFRASPVGIFSLQLFVNNLFDSKYIANGWASTDVFKDGSVLNWTGFYPQAPRNYMARLTLSF